MPLDLAQAIAQYGTLGLLANAIPDLKTKLEQGAREEWTPDKFWAEIQQTGWWTSSSDTRRQAETLRVTNPATWEQAVSNTVSKIANMANEMGTFADPARYRELAEQSLRTQMDDATLRNVVGAMGLRGQGGAYEGAAANLEKQIRSTYKSYGVPVTDEFLKGAVQWVLQGGTSLDSYESLARQAAKSRYPQLADELDSGKTVADIANPYLATMAQTLEIPEGDIDLNDGLIQRALGDRDEKGVPRSKPLWAFERELKDDPRWDRTKGARNQTYDMLSKVGQDFGFSAG